MSVLVDTDILIEVSRATPSTLDLWIALSHSHEQILYSPISEAELWQGVRPREMWALRNLLSELECVLIDKRIGRKAGDYLRQYRKSHGVQMSDALIAASAVLNEAWLWTRNLKHYPMPDVMLYSPQR
jgi:predicted nucleic acid-binding protein